MTSDSPPPRLIFNTDGNWILNYLPARRPDDITRQIDELVDAGVEALAVLAGIDDAPSWRGGPSDMWGDHVEVWNPDPRKKGEDQSVPSKAADYLKHLHDCMEAVIDDGRELMQIYIDACRRRGIAAYCSFRMNDAHTCDERREWQVRGRLKCSRPDLLIGPLVREGGHGSQWAFSWQWDYAREEVHERLLGLVDDALNRFDFDGIELDWMRQPPFFKPGQVFANIDTLTDFMRKAREVVAGHARHRARGIQLITRIPPSLDEALELGLDSRTWMREGLADLFVLSSASLCTPAVDVAAAAGCAAAAGAAVYTGFDGTTHLTSPHEGYDRGQPCMLRAVAHNGYLQGAAGVHLFNYDIRHHRAAPADGDGYNADHLQLIGDLADPQALAGRDRDYVAADSSLGGNPAYSHGDHRPQVPRQLPVLARGTGGAGFSIDIAIEDDLEAGRADGRIRGTQLRLRLTDHEVCRDRIVCRLNGNEVTFAGASTVENRLGDTWLVIDEPPVRQGMNEILVGLSGLKTPEPWPVLHQCEVMVLCGDR